MDGNISLSSVCSSDESCSTNPNTTRQDEIYIQVISGNRPDQVMKMKRNPVQWR